MRFTRPRWPAATWRLHNALLTSCSRLWPRPCRIRFRPRVRERWRKHACLYWSIEGHARVMVCSAAELQKLAVVGLLAKAVRVRWDRREAGSSRPAIACELRRPAAVAGGRNALEPGHLGSANW